MFAKEDQAKKDAFDESDDESAISRTESELREVTKVLFHCTLCLLSSQDSFVCKVAKLQWVTGRSVGATALNVSRMIYCQGTITRGQLAQRCLVPLL